MLTQFNNSDHLQHNRKADQAKAPIKTNMQVFVFMIDQEGKYNTIYRFQVKGKVLGKCRDILQGL